MGNKLYVGNLPFSATDQSISDLFSTAGTVTSAKIITDLDSGRIKGFGFVEMSTSEEAQTAISKFNGVDNGGRPMTVSEAKPQEPRDRGSRGGGFRGGGGGHGGGGRNRY